jgi:hypothetical protein
VGQRRSTSWLILLVPFHSIPYSLYFTSRLGAT